MDWTLKDAMRLYEQYCLSRGKMPGGGDEDSDELDKDEDFEDEDFGDKDFEDEDFGDEDEF